jgi:hypothetical protein
MRRILWSACSAFVTRAHAWLIPLLLSASLAAAVQLAVGATWQDPPFPSDSTFVVPEGEGELGPTPDEPYTTNEPQDTLGTAAPDTTGTAAPPDTTGSAPSDTTGTAASDTTGTFEVPIKPPADAAMDTLSLPGTGQAPPATTPAGSRASPPATPPPVKARTGLLGIHPAAILIGLAALNYFIIKWATD